VHYEITGPVLDFQYCHCSRCRKFTGSAHAANLFTRKEHLEWVRGADAVQTYKLDATPGFATAFCSRCGSSLPNMSSTGKFWVVPAGTLDTDPALKPRRSIYWESRAPWFVETGELPHHSALPPKD